MVVYFDLRNLEEAKALQADHGGWVDSFLQLQDRPLVMKEVIPSKHRVRAGEASKGAYIFNVDLLVWRAKMDSPSLAKPSD